MGCSLLHLLDSAPALVTTAMTALASTSYSDKACEIAADALVELMAAGNTTLAVGNEKASSCTHAVAEQLQQMAATLRLPEDAAAGGYLEGIYCRVQTHLSRQPPLSAHASRPDPPQTLLGRPQPRPPATNPRIPPLRHRSRFPLLPAPASIPP